ncbi:SH3 domain [Arabidopsis thaliana x Arabidopsis arenosa]|uniref:SH3 domain-containing protein n=3 Tax=Arabidopsis TaxID=3701 RepID=A0A178UWF4_ARATH|nr:SH3 domain [Arabidopsis thaliana x Arabidopsis arenosa]OAO97697.1 hypothetical protein AXX17_AT4G44370 [Arabidopsis thaliana]
MFKLREIRLFLQSLNNKWCLVIQLVVSLSIGTSSIYFYDIWESSLKKNVTFFKFDDEDSIVAYYGCRRGLDSRPINYNIIVFTKTLMMAECCEECCEQMEEDAYSEWLREANDGVNASQMHNGTSDAMGYFLGEVMFPYQADSDFELSLSVGDYVVIREVVSSVWAEGECKGNAGWFTYIYIERRDRVFATKVIEVF